MSFTTFSTALSGLQSNTVGLNAVGNNLANLNTVAYKATNITFQDVLGESITGADGNGANIGLGVQLGRVSSVFNQGGLETTNSPTDVAIQGTGFFVVSDGTAQLYTRAGNFHVDAEGKLVTPTGHKVQGFPRDPITGIIDTNSELADITILTKSGNSKATSEFELALNLDGGAAVGETFSTATPIFDPLGQSHLATLEFVKTAVTATDATWSFDITIPETDLIGIPATSTNRFSLLTGAVATTPPAAGSLVFDSNGTLISVYTGAAPSPLPPVADLPVPPPAVTIPSFSNSGTLNPSGTVWKLVSASGDPNATGLASASNISFSHQDGVAPGDMKTLSILPDGAVAGLFSNGVTLEVAKIAIAQFNNQDGLTQQGNGLFAESTASGSLLLGIPGQGGCGRLVGGALELSNVDLANEFTKIITYQRGYQANARMISSTDEILQETMNLNR